MSNKRHAKQAQRRKANKKAKFADRKKARSNEPIIKTDSHGDRLVVANFRPTGRDWTGDRDMYVHKCAMCDLKFHGDKARGICTACAPVVFTDEEFGELETEFSIHAAESGLDRELDYCPERCFDAWLDNKYPQGWAVVE